MPVKDSLRCNTTFFNISMTLWSFAKRQWATVCVCVYVCVCGKGVVRGWGRGEGTKQKNTHSPRRANSMDLIAVVLRVPVVTRKDAASSIPSDLKARIWKAKEKKKCPKLKIKGKHNSDRFCFQEREKSQSKVFCCRTI